MKNFRDRYRDMARTLASTDLLQCSTVGFPPARLFALLTNSNLRGLLGSIDVPSSSAFCHAKRLAVEKS